ncbi:MAG: hypothetical protein M0R17_10560 [Candidatus Omnitrophica bacterium]|nr:hypothetical protein [Candidatus Omnitrophota bacterium]
MSNERIKLPVNAMSGAFGILDTKYINCRPTMPLYNAMCVFDIEAAKLAFIYGDVDFVFVLNENTGKFARCCSVKEVEDYLTTEEK